MLVIVLLAGNVKSNPVRFAGPVTSVTANPIGCCIV